MLLISCKSVFDLFLRTFVGIPLVIELGSFGDTSMLGKSWIGSFTFEYLMYCLCCKSFGGSTQVTLTKVSFCSVNSSNTGSSWASFPTI